TSNSTDAAATKPHVVSRNAIAPAESIEPSIRMMRQPSPVVCAYAACACPRCACKRAENSLETTQPIDFPPSQGESSMCHLAGSVMLFGKVKIAKGANV